MVISFSNCVTHTYQSLNKFANWAELFCLFFFVIRLSSSPSLKKVFSPTWHWTMHWLFSFNLSIYFNRQFQNWTTKKGYSWYIDMVRVFDMSRQFSKKNITLLDFRFVQSRAMAQILPFSSVLHVVLLYLISFLFVT